MSDADATVQSMEDASPAKWHLAHTTWFFETFVLRARLGAAPYDPRWPFLFNSYYEAEGQRLARPARGMLTRPSLVEIMEYRAYVDAAVEAQWDRLDQQGLALVELGCHHEEQHQELLLTDILHLFAQNPLRPTYADPPPHAVIALPEPLMWIPQIGGPAKIGHSGKGFAFDCEGPRHVTWLVPHALSDRLITNAEWLTFMEDGAYRTPSLWLSDGWAWVQRAQACSPLYWRQANDGSWSEFSLYGQTPLQPAAPVRHINYFEADAFARWASARLPTEAEWEVAASGCAALEEALGDVQQFGRSRPSPTGTGLKQLYSELWQWTASAYLAYPGFKPAEGAVGEYNGKFMSGQFVLKGGSCVTPPGHIRPTYRNFFYPHQRWQFTGVRLAKDL